jgi:hypothetical protein
MSTTTGKRRQPTARPRFATSARRHTPHLADGSVHAALLASIRSVLFAVPGKAAVHPGPADATVGREKDESVSDRARDGRSGVDQ